MRKATTQEIRKWRVVLRERELTKTEISAITETIEN
jgi:hypothetical protein